MRIIIPRHTAVAAALGLLLLARQTWKESLVVELDPRLDQEVMGALVDVPRHFHEMSLMETTPFLKRDIWGTPARLKFSLDTPSKPYTSAVFRQTYIQVVAPFTSLRPPLEPDSHHSLAFMRGQAVYTADPLAYARYHEECPDLALLRTNDEVLAKLQKDPASIGILNVQNMVPQVRALSSPFPLRVWMGWVESPSRFLAALGTNVRLYSTVDRLLNDATIQDRPRWTSVVAVGDIMLARRIGEGIDRRRLSHQEPLYPFASTSGIFRNADIAMGNLECAIAENGAPQPGKDYTFRADPRAANLLKDAGFTLLNLANNHSMDYGPEAFEQTFDLLHVAGLTTSGGGRDAEEASSLTIIRQRDGTRFGFLSYTLVVPVGFPASSDQVGVNTLEPRRFEGQIRRAKSECDVLVVQFHWGKEYQIHPNDDQRRYGHLAIDYGADLVVGHHPHWIQEMEFYRGRFIAYSLGNFVFDMDHRPKVREGLMLRCYFRAKELVQVVLDPVQIRHGEPVVIPWQSREKRSRETILKEVFDAGGFGEEKTPS